MNTHSDKKEIIKLTTRERVEEFVNHNYRMLIVLELLIVCTVSWFLFLQPMYQSIQELRAQGYQSSVNRLQERKQYLEEVRTMNGEYAKLETERLRQLENILPNGFNTTTTISTMQSFADAAGIRIKSIDVVNSSIDPSATPDASVVTPKKNIAKATITMNIDMQDDSYAGLKKFLDALESFVPILDLENLTYSAETHSFALQLNTYYIPDPTQ